MLLKDQDKKLDLRMTLDRNMKLIMYWQKHNVYIISKSDC